ncbi:uncharacterized protein BO95DRAFT_186611 [Aspergillus brunneoviolaceus CBS 621.78]|uniref:Uncharacterized protein n=1 Tax=Aspergillus brunneoviolaceus CBS 621.78 TaxID=1450534 RepID=A0ACD1G4R7_9EURO|nr:hypothetical protein BO95DRAFT_186611 [Aspergillus brunneoviolaceus CBS 621.78]RAH44149.1 hypothetical protein BO95DRAFT_186611 [Aspergillus brunneoviolaceus CBS 621.78]
MQMHQRLTGTKSMWFNSEAGMQRRSKYIRLTVAPSPDSTGPKVRFDSLLLLHYAHFTGKLNPYHPFLDDKFADLTPRRWSPETRIQESHSLTWFTASPGNQ